MNNENEKESSLQRWAQRGHILTKAGWLFLIVSIVVVAIRRLA